MKGIVAEGNEVLALCARHNEVITHPSWYGCIDERTAVDLLQDEPVMSYILRQGNEGVYDYWISHKKSPWEVHHRHFSIKRFSEELYFTNLRAPKSKSLDEFIMGALSCLL